MQKSPQNFVVFGPSGAGKGTQAEFIASKYNLTHLVIGDILRTVQKEKGVLSQKIEKSISQGKWVTDDLVNQVMAEAVTKSDPQKGIIFDGYPRTLKQAKYLDQLLAKLGRTAPIIINLKVSEKSVTYRLLNRKVCSKCGALFHPPSSLTKTACNKCRGKLTRRTDDTGGIIQQRLAEFNQNVAEILKYYQGKDKIISIDGEPAIPQVSREIAEKLKNIQ